MLGVKQNYISNPKITTLDLCHAATLNIIKALKWKPKDIDIVVFVTQTPDYLMPSCSNIIHEKLELKKRVHLLDINLGCSGYVYGLWNISSIMQDKKFKKGLLLVETQFLKQLKKMIK